MKIRFLFFLFFIVLCSNLAFATYYYSPMNFEESRNHTFDIDITGFINVTIPNNFSLVSGSLTGNDSLSFILESPSLNSSSPELFIGTIYLNGSKFTDYHLLSVADEKIVDTKVEIGHGDFNYIDHDEFIGTDNTMLFNLVRVWAIGSDIINEPATNVRFNCTFPLIIPNTVDSKYTTTYNSSNIVASGDLSRMEGISMFRVFVLSQEVDYLANTTYGVDCSQLTYNFSHTSVVADIPGFNLSVRDINPLMIEMTNNSGYVTYSILNNELYDLRNLEFIWEIGTHTTREKLDSLGNGDVVSYNIQTNASGNIDFKVRFIPQWMFNSRSPLHYEQIYFNNYNTPQFLDGLNTSSLFSNQSVLNTPLFETQVMDFSISLLEEAPFGGSYKITYMFYNEEGVLSDTVERQIIGIDDHTVSFSSLELIPNGLEEFFDVYTTISVRDDEGEWHDFDQELIGQQVLVKLTDNGAKSQVGLYDVIVSTRYDRYKDDDVVIGDIKIKNTGDSPDEDTILTYYLISPDGEKFGETKEQILEVPPGETILTRSITLPTKAGNNLGEWQFEVLYETVVQSDIIVYDSFELVTGLSFSVFDEFDKNVENFSIYGWFLLWFVVLVLLLVSITIRVYIKKENR